jgi:hypothetical protein
MDFWQKRRRRSAALLLVLLLAPPVLESHLNTPLKYVEKVFNWSEAHLSEMTCYKIHTLIFLNKVLGMVFNSTTQSIPNGCL